MQRLRRRQVHTEGLIVRPLQSTLKWIQANKGLPSEQGGGFDCGGYCCNDLTHAALIGQSGFPDFLNRSDDCGGLRARRDSDLRRSRSYRGDWPLPVVWERGHFHGRCVRFGLGFTDGFAQSLIEECTLENILPRDDSAWQIT